VSADEAIKLNSSYPNSHINKVNCLVALSLMDNALLAALDGVKACPNHIPLKQKYDQLHDSFNTLLNATKLQHQ
jgi:hypothetical protein